MTAEPESSAERRPGMSLRLTLTAWIASIAGSVCIVLLVFVLLHHINTLSGFFNQRVESRVVALAQAIDRAPGPVTDEMLDRIGAQSPRLLLDSLTILAVYDADGSLVASSRPAPAAAGLHLAPPRPDAQTTHIVRRRLTDIPPAGDDDFRVASRAILLDGRPATLVFITTDEHYERLATSAIRIVALTTSLGVVIALGAGWLIAGHAVAPFTRLRRVTASLWSNEAGTPPRAGRTSREIDALESDLVDVRARLERALHAQDRFITSVSHEIKTPIAVLLAQANAMASNDLPPAAAEFVRSVADEMRVLGRMVESLLLLTRFRSEGASRIATHPLNDVVMDAVDATNAPATAQGVAISATLADEEPAPLVAGERDLLRLMLENLLRHAVRFSPRGSRVTIAVSINNGSCDVLIRDAGPAVPPALAEAMFERTRPSAGAGRHGRGYDIGLSIAQSIAVAHEGGVRVTAAPDRGCEFVLTLPRRQPTPIAGP